MNEHKSHEPVSTLFSVHPPAKRLQPERAARRTEANPIRPAVWGNWIFSHTFQNEPLTLDLC